MNTEPKRIIGPVTTAAGGGAAAAGIICWLVSTFAHIPVPAEVQGYLAIVLVIAAGWAVKPATTPAPDPTGYLSPAPAGRWPAAAIATANNNAATDAAALAAAATARNGNPA